jgi:hypothetical protein
MSNFVVLKMTGKDGYWLVDIDGQTVSPMDGIAPDAFGYSKNAESSGAVFSSGIDVAVVAETRDDAFAGKYDT